MIFVINSGHRGWGSVSPEYPKVYAKLQKTRHFFNRSSKIGNR